MISTVKFKEASIRYKDEGKGNVVVLLHGYLESLDSWGTFADELAKQFRVVSVDLPGHGKSGEFTQVDTMAVMADAVKHVLDQLDIGRAMITGHSMGGYASLAFAEIYPEITVGFCLFHSHALPDSEEKKLNRDREIELVRAGKKIQIIQANIPKMFADDNIDRFHAELERAKKIAEATTDHGIICALEGMKARPDCRRVISESRVPMFMIAGKKDNYIPFELAQQHFDLSPLLDVLVLENSGHLGYIEEPEESLEGLLYFLKKVF